MVTGVRARPLAHSLVASSLTRLFRQRADDLIESICRDHVRVHIAGASSCRGSTARDTRARSTHRAGTPPNVDTTERGRTIRGNGSSGSLGVDNGKTGSYTPNIHDACNADSG